MIYLLFGNDVRKSRRILRDFISRFDREVPQAWHMIDCREVEASGLGSLSLFAPKDYTIVKYASEADEEMAGRLAMLLTRWAEDDSVVVFFETSVPSKNKLFDEIKMRATKKQEFIPDARKTLDEVANELSSAQKHLLVARFGSDLERLVSEAEKQVLGGELSRDTSLIPDQELFLLGDLWGRRDKIRAFLHLHKLLEGGIAADALCRTLLWHVKNLALVLRGSTEGLHPFVIKKSREEGRNFTLESLESAYRELLMLDVSDKWGRGSIEAGLFRFVLKY